VSLDKAALCREGQHVTILGWLAMHHFAMAAAEELATEHPNTEAINTEAINTEAINTEVIDVRSLNPIDYETIGRTVVKTGRVVIVEEGPKTGGAGAEIATGIMERFGKILMAPVQRVASPDIPVPHSPMLENAYRPDVSRILQAARARMSSIA
jgi:pyruvate/2-oxoglutarate/acetoin dehydrogenase E1 component